MITLKTGPNVVGKKQNQLYITSDDIKALKRELDSKQFAYIEFSDHIVISNNDLNLLIKAVGKDRLNTEDKAIQKRIDVRPHPPTLTFNNDYVFPELKLPLHQAQKEALYFGIEQETYLLADLMGPQPLWAKVLTKEGFVEIGSLKVGDYVYGQDGELKKVLQTLEQGVKDVYEITFSDRTKAYSSGDHLWDVFNSEGTLKTKRLSTIIEDMAGSSEELDYYLPPIEPVKSIKDLEDGTEPKTIVSIEDYSSERTVCITVEDSLYITDGYTVTHNSGKSLTAIATAEYLKEYFGFKHVLIVNGVNSNQHNWAREVAKFTDSTSKILGMREIQRGPRKGKWTIRGNPEKLTDLQEDLDEFFLITNIEALRNEAVADRLAEMIYEGSIGMVVVDEIHKVVNTESQQGKGLLKLAPRFRIGMSGTPFNSPEDLYMTAYWLGRTYKSKTSYKDRYGETVLEGRFHAYRFREHELFKKDIENYVLRRTDTIKDLPEISFTDYILELGPKQREMHDKVAVPAMELMTSGLTVERMAGELKKSIHIEGRKAVNIPHIFGIEEDVKMDAVKELLSEILANGKTALLYTYFKEAVENYGRELEKTFPGEGHYVTEGKDAFTEVDNFQKGEGSFIVGTVGKIGTGLNITRADYVIFIDRPSSWGIYEQAFMRPWRQGRENPVHVIKLVCLDTWDEAITATMQETKENMDKVFGKVQDDSSVKDVAIDID